MEWLGQLLASDVFRGGTLLVAVVTGVTAVTLQILKSGPVLAKLEDEARKALDESTQTELRRLAEQVVLQARLHAECETELDKMRKTVRKVEDDMEGLRRQLVQYEQTTVSMLRNQAGPPEVKK